MNKKAVITGANRGIGKCFAMKCAQKGYDLLLIARDNGMLEECFKEIKSKYTVDVTIISADLSKPEDVKALVLKISEDTSIELLINNAGFAIPSFFIESDIEAQMDMVRVHNEALLRLTRAVLPIMKNNRKGAIINVSSTLAYIPFVTNSVYCASKAFINVFSDILQREVKGYGILVQALNPGRTKTDFYNRAAFQNVEKTNPKNKEISPEAVVDISFRKLGKSVVVIPGLNNKMMILFKKITANMIMKKKGIK
ncbi:MAG: SDR family NAD(P)-dependent oxidoreductase [Bacteroidales bacterium]|nr:SDR family NAD(P)-dependent oxidoreductase [Bacteroidales bacterium]